MGKRMKTDPTPLPAAKEALSPTLEDLARLVTELEEGRALDRVRELLAAGTPPLDILAACQKGMRNVGALHEEGRYYMAALIMAGEIMREALDLLRPLLAQGRSPEGRGRVLLGTIAGDIHDIGKDLLKDLLECHGLTVQDLGVDVPPEAFLKAADAFEPDVVAVSVLITESFPRLKELASLFEESARKGGRKPPLLIGGGQIDERICRICGADRWAPDAFEGLRVCLELLGDRQGD